MEASKSFFLLLMTFLTAGACSTEILSCLSAGGVTNVSTISDSSYPELLNHSIKDLRFTRPLLPKPFALIFPENTNQVAAALLCATKAGSSSTIRVRSGGHSYEGMSSVADGDDPFVIIDMMKLNRVTVDLHWETAWVQAGATLGDVYYAIGNSTRNYGFSAGICPSVGSGGHFSGGGHGPLVRKYGLAADNILDAILVDAHGRILDRAAMGEEVFWAIRGGGGGSWGVVAEWKIRLLKVPERVSAFRVTRTGTTSEAAELWYKWQMVAPGLEDDYYLTMNVLPRNGTIGITLTFLGLFLGPKSSALVSINRAFPELGITSEECKEMSWAESTLLFDLTRDIKDHGVIALEDLKRNIKAVAFSKNKSDYVKDPIPIIAIEGALEMVARQPKSSLLMDTYGGMVNRIRNDSISFPHRNNLYAIQYFVVWKAEDDWRSDGYIDWIRKLHEYMRPFVSKNPRAVYVNYVDLDLGVMDWRNRSMCGSGADAVEVARVWGVRYFIGNYDRLVRAKTLIDPKNVFRNQQSIPPLNLNPATSTVI